MWDSVAKTQSELSAGLGSRVASPQSATSLQLSLEHAKLKEAQAAYIAALEARGLADGDVIGYVAAINGKTVSANIYPSNGLFRKMWVKQLAAVATEAIGAKSGTAVARPARCGSPGVPRRGREGHGTGARDGGEDVPGNARQRGRALQRGALSQRQVDAQELPGEVAV